VTGSADHGLGPAGSGAASHGPDPAGSGAAGHAGHEAADHPAGAAASREASHPASAAGNREASHPAGAARLTWRRVFPGDERQLRLLRRWLAALLPDCTARDDVVTTAVELATNAIKFSRSGRGGSLAVQVSWSGSVVRVAVADGGAPTGPRLIDDPMSEHGRGLQIVHALSIRTGVCGDHRGRLVWADIAWTGQGAAEPALLPAGYEDAIRRDHAALAERFAGVPVWFGRSTLQWWAAPGRTPRRLLTAPSAADLAGQLDRLLAPRTAGQHLAVVTVTAERTRGRASVPVPPAWPVPVSGWVSVPVPRTSPVSAPGRVSVPAAPLLRPPWPQLSRLRARPC